MTKRPDWSAEEKVEIGLAGIKGDKSIAQICRDNNISQSTYYSWRDKFLYAAKSAFRNGTPSNEKALQSEIEDLEHTVNRHNHRPRKSLNYRTTESLTVALGN